MWLKKIRLICTLLSVRYIQYKYIVASTCCQLVSPSYGTPLLTVFVCSHGMSMQVTFKNLTLGFTNCTLCVNVSPAHAGIGGYQS